MFVDEVTITVKGGNGGNGVATFRREKYVPYGGPDGGNGGNGGDVIVQAEHNCDTLSDFRVKKIFQAPDGVRGGSQKLAGKNAIPLVLKVPVGTCIYDESTKELLYDLATEGEQCVIAKGGRGGYGNAHFVSSVRQAPKFAELGDSGEQRKITLVLKLVADVGIIGFPNAGKSTLISHISNVRPKIANYPFTTLIPNLGIVNHKGKSFVISDNPGLIEGAAGGKGLGIAFLKHIERTRVLLHLIDGTAESPYKTCKLLLKELKKYDTKKKKTLGVFQHLMSKKQIFVINKIDTLSDKDLASLQKEFQKNKLTPLFCISAASGKNITSLLDYLIKTLDSIKKETPDIPSVTQVKIFRPHIDNPHYYTINKVKQGFQVTGERIEQIVRMTPLNNHEAMERVYDVLYKMGIQKDLLRRGAKDGQHIFIGKADIIFRD